MKNGFSVLVIFSLLSGCANQDDSILTAKEYGEKWPLVSSSAKIGCDPKAIAWVEVDGTRYALNGNAMRAGLPNADAIKNKANANSMFLADFTERAMQLCIEQGHTR